MFVDLAAGTGGNRVSFPGAPADTLLGFEGVIGSTLDDVVVGNVFRNRLQGGGGGDVLDGADGADHLLGEAGDDLLIGGPRRRCAGRRAGADLLVGGDGTDFASYAGSEAGVTVDLLRGTGLGGEAQGDRHDGIEAVLGSDQDDRLSGDNAANTLIGGKGEDTLRGCGGNDLCMAKPPLASPSAWPRPTAPSRSTTRMRGLREGRERRCRDGQRRDRHPARRRRQRHAAWLGRLGPAPRGARTTCCFGGRATDLLFGGEGNDTLHGGAGFDIIFGGVGLDVASYSATPPAAVTVDLSRFWANAGGDAASNLATELLSTVTAQTNLEASIGLGLLAGLLGLVSEQSPDLAAVLNIPDMLFGIEGVVGSRFATVCPAMSGPIRTTAGSAPIRWPAARAATTNRVDNAADLVIETVLGGVADTVESSVNHTLAANVEDLLLTGAAINGVGNALDNLIRGNAPANRLSGQDGADRLEGGAGADTLLSAAQAPIRWQAGSATTCSSI